jgi:hypothetical protein
MSAAHDAFTAILDVLPDDAFVISESPSMNPVIPPGKHCLTFYAAAVDPVPLGAGKFRDPTWKLAIISPVTSIEAAAGPLFDALYDVLDVLEAHESTRWETATMEPYGETLWCYSVDVKMYTQRIEEEEE